MSLVRPAAAQMLRRWSEPAIAAATVGVLGWSGLSVTLSGGLFGWFLLAAMALALFWLRAATLGALASRPVTGTGMAVFREGEIGYMGPHGGGFVELAELARVEIYLVAEDHDPVWRLVGQFGAAIAIPATAEGAGHLPEALTVLPGFSDLTAVGILQRARPGRHVVWERVAGQGGPVSLN